jgi:hypothetical protein
MALQTQYPNPFDTVALLTAYAQLYDLAAVQAEDTAGTKAYDIVRRTLYQEVRKKIGAFNNAQNV